MTGSGRFATPFLCDSFIQNSTSVHPGALRNLVKGNWLPYRTAAGIDPRQKYVYTGGSANSVGHPAAVPPAVVLTPDFPPVARCSMVGQLPLEQHIEVLEGQTMKYPMA
jgi:hypothetical protein